MAIDASGNVRGALRSRSSTPRISYNVGASCRPIALSIVALLALFVVLILL